jgi:hypothetical protein
VTLALAILIGALGGGYFLEDRYQTIKAAAAHAAGADAARHQDYVELELAQAQTAADLTHDIQALRLQNVTMELNAIYEREEARRSYPTDAARKDQLLAQMAAIIMSLEK